mmetsp:Transcript_29967/g.65869  ORF Transcript_29967/g.65869 Transcript_29967/m.65869 type:complete len:346 (-) Transcript_29967:951-1988(-)
MSCGRGTGDSPHGPSEKRWTLEGPRLTSAPLSAHASSGFLHTHAAATAVAVGPGLFHDGVVRDASPDHLGEGHWQRNTTLSPSFSRRGVGRWWLRRRRRSVGRGPHKLRGHRLQAVPPAPLPHPPAVPRGRRHGRPDGGRRGLADLGGRADKGGILLGQPQLSSNGHEDSEEGGGHDNGQHRSGQNHLRSIGHQLDEGIIVDVLRLTVLHTLVHEIQRVGSQRCLHRGLRAPRDHGEALLLEGPLPQGHGGDPGGDAAPHQPDQDGEKSEPHDLPVQLALVHRRAQQGEKHDATHVGPEVSDDGGDGCGAVLASLSPLQVLDSGSERQHSQRPSATVPDPLEAKQ